MVEREDQEEDGAKLFIHWLVLALIFFVAPGIEQIAERIEDVGGWDKEEEDVNPPGLARDEIADVAERHGFALLAHVFYDGEESAADGAAVAFGVFELVEETVNTGGVHYAFTDEALRVVGAGEGERGEGELAEDALDV